MKIIGIDIDSKKFGLVCLDDKEYSYSSFFLSGLKNAQDRNFELYDSLKRVLIKHRPDFVFIEDSMFSKNYNTSRLITESVHNCKIICRDLKIPFYTVQNRKWKKEVIGNGSVSKEEIATFIINKYPELNGSPQDVLDSCGVALYGFIVKGEND